ncbi:DNA-binding transcription factor CAT8 [Kluyveromyces lactis]|uniref:KLLA0D01452p n=2 Tax=Kluyveromyces lactis TaxID=28985 RepID=F2Z5X6_KLULA|nr:uncharacterized protein KLLA0_D01452g [Kluyveromyces lactis]AAC23607.1 Cat8p [Kluyveromyces lactis]CAH00229.1 KLLA0D01452p [Kluyveromyces lactis]|eukprot:XP_453133.1 uncharacterized protein KLLA0_D01452g [Kluyveromyces lactis]
MVEKKDSAGRFNGQPSHGGPRFIRTLGSQSLSGLNPLSNAQQGVSQQQQHLSHHSHNVTDSDSPSIQDSGIPITSALIKKESPSHAVSGIPSNSNSINNNSKSNSNNNPSSVFSSRNNTSIQQLQQGPSPTLSNSESPVNASLLSSITTPLLHQTGSASHPPSNTGSSTNGTTTPSYRVAQACDRCRAKKIRCDGKRPQCTQCAAVGFECKISDKLSRRAFPRGYTETLEERVRELEAENRRLVALCDLKEEQLHLVSKYSNSKDENGVEIPSTEEEQILHELSKTNGGSLRVSSTNLYLLNKKASPGDDSHIESSEPSIPVRKVAITAPSPRIMSPRNSVADSDPSQTNTGNNDHIHSNNNNHNQNNSTDPYGISFEQNEAPGLPALKALSSLSKYKQGTQLATLVAVSVPRTTEEILFVPQLLARIGQIHGFTSKQCIYTASVLASLKENNISSIPPELEVLKNHNLWEIDDVLHFWKNVFKLDFMTHTAVDHSSTHLNFAEVEELMQLFFQDWYELIPLFDKNEFNSYYEKFKLNVTDPNFFVRKDDTVFNNRTRSISYKIFSCLLIIIVQMGMLSKIKRDKITSGKLSTLMKYYDKLMTHIWINPYFNSRNTSIQVLQCLSMLLFYMLNVGDISSIYELRGKVVSMSQQLRLHRCPSAVLGGDGSTVSKVQQGERRILFWSIYYLDVFSALQLGVPRLLKDFEIECALPVTSDDDRQVNLAGQMIALEGKVSQFSLSVIRFAKVMGNILDSTFKRGMTTSLTKQAALVHENALDNWRHGLQKDLFFQLDVNGTINMDEFNQQKQYSKSLSPRTAAFTHNSLVLMTLYFMAKCMIHLPVVATKPLVAEAIQTPTDNQTENGSVDRSLSSYVLLQQATNTLLNVLTALNSIYLPLPINLARTKTRFGLFSARGSLEYTKGGALFQDNKALLLDLVKELETDKKLELPGNTSWHSLKLFDLSINLILQPVNSNPEKTEKMIQKKINYYNKLMGQPTVAVKRKRDPKATENTSKKVKVEDDHSQDNLHNITTGETTDTVHSEELVKDVPKELNVYPENYTTIEEAFQMDPVLNTNLFSNTDLKTLFNSGIFENAGSIHNNINDNNNNNNNTNNTNNNNGSSRNIHNLGAGIEDIDHGMSLRSNDASLLNLSNALGNHGNSAEGMKDGTSVSNLLNLSTSDSLFKVPSNGDFLKDYYINNMSNTGLSNLHTSSVNKGPSLSQLGSLFMSSGSGTNLPYSNVRGESKHPSGVNLNKQRAQPAMDGFSFAADASLGLAPLLAWSPDAKPQLNSNNGNDGLNPATGIVLESGDNDSTNASVVQLQQHQQQTHHPPSHNSSSIPMGKQSSTSDRQNSHHQDNVGSFHSMHSPTIPEQTSAQGLHQHQMLGMPNSTLNSDTNTGGANVTNSISSTNRRGPRRRWNNAASSSDPNSAGDSSVSDLLRWQNGN